MLGLGQADGPILDSDDSLADVILDPKVEIIVVTPRSKPSSNTLSDTQQVPKPQIPPQPRGSARPVIKLRVITPALARAHKDVRTIPIVQNANITSNSTLRDIKVQVSQHLGIAEGSFIQVDEECNCSFARQIDERGGISAASNLSGAAFKVVVVHGRNKVQILDVEDGKKSSITEMVHRELGDETGSKKTTFM